MAKAGSNDEKNLESIISLNFPFVLLNVNSYRTPGEVDRFVLRTPWGLIQNFNNKAGGKTLVELYLHCKLTANIDINMSGTMKQKTHIRCSIMRESYNLFLLIVTLALFPTEFL